MAYIPGTPGNDFLQGTQAADRIEGFGGNDELIGLGGADTLIGGEGDDFLHGGAGTDLYDGGPGSDTASFYGAIAAVVVDLGPGRARVGTSPFETLISIENLVGTDWNDTLIGNSVANVLEGGDGDDVARGRGGNDRFINGQGDDRFYGDAGNDTFVFADFGPGSNPMTSIAPGSASAPASLGSDVVVGGGGVDTLIWRVPYADLTDTEYFDYGCSGIWLEGPSTPHIVVDLAGGVAHWAATGTHATITGVENVVTGATNDVVNGSNAGEIINVGRGANLVHAGGGRDTIYGARYLPKDQVDVGSDSDPYFAYEFYDYDTREQDEALHGGAGNDVIRGGARMFGDGGNDILASGRGGCEMTGGAGADRFEFWTGFGIYASCDTDLVYEIFESGTITDFQRGIDRIVIETHAAAAELPFGGFDVATALGVYTITHDNGGSRILLGHALDPDTGDQGFGLSIRVSNAEVTPDDIVFV